VFAVVVPLSLPYGFLICIQAHVVGDRFQVEEVNDRALRVATVATATVVQAYFKIAAAVSNFERTVAVSSTSRLLLRSAVVETDSPVGLGVADDGTLMRLEDVVVRGTSSQGLDSTTGRAELLRVHLDVRDAVMGIDSFGAIDAEHLTARGLNGILVAESHMHMEAFDLETRLLGLDVTGRSDVRLSDGRLISDDTAVLVPQTFELRNLLTRVQLSGSIELR
jgi:hypothetical protein